MITTQLPKIKLEGLTVYEIVQLTGETGIDLYDKNYDWATYMDCCSDWDHCGDWYDHFCLLLCINLKCIRGDAKHNTCECDVAGFIANNLGAFRKFCNEENKDEYKPSYYEDQGEVLDPDEDGPFYDVYMNTMESLLVGNYSDHDYHKLYCYLTGEKYDPESDEDDGE